MPKLLCVMLVLAFQGSLTAQTFLKRVPRSHDSVVGTAGVAKGVPFYLDLQPQGNKSLEEEMNDPIYRGDNLAELKVGIFRTSSGVPFQVGREFVCLKGRHAPDRPASVKFQVNRTAAGFYFLHGCGWGAYGKPGDAVNHFERDGTAIGMYVITYEDDDIEFMPIVYGKDVRDWWGVWDRMQPTKGSEEAWRGTNEHLKGRREAAGMDKPLRLYMSVWKNPWPTLNIKTIEFLSEESIAAPFCIAITGYSVPEGNAIPATLSPTPSSAPTK